MGRIATFLMPGRNSEPGIGVSLLGGMLLAVTLAMSSAPAPAAGREVVIYTSLDQVFSEPILNSFEKARGIRVKIVYDVEASKTAGLVNRLMAEKSRPKCDVFWSSEIARTIALKQQGVLAPYRSPSAADIPATFKDKEDYWTGFSARARVLIYNRSLIKGEDLPRSIFELTDPRWKGKVVLAYPLFGTTANHIAALYVALGKEKTEAYLKALKANEVVIVDGNAVSRDVVVEGQFPLGFTDSDDVNVAVQSGKPVGLILPDDQGLGTLLIPNTVALVKNGPNPKEGRELIDYLLSREVESQLAYSEAAQIPVRTGVPKPSNVLDISSITFMKVDYQEVAEKINEAARFCQTLFVR
jgi:iron(III) transport system substrate-binding protein